MKEEYIRRINAVLEHIDHHLDEELSLEQLASVGCYSPFHLHRLFKAITGEPLNAYVIRKRVERSALQLVHRKNMSIGDIALQNGFGSHASFTRAFRKLYGQSPSAFREANAGNFSKIGKTESKKGKQPYITEAYLRNIDQLQHWITMHATVNVQEMPARRLAYVTHIGVEGLETAFGRILRWAGSRGIMSQPQAHIVRVFHDSFKITDADKVRMSIGITVDEQVKAEDDIGIRILPAGKYIVGRFEIPVAGFELSWNSMFIWMSEKGYKKSADYPFEIYHNDYRQHPEQKCIVDLCIPIE